MRQRGTAWAVLVFTFIVMVAMSERAQAQLVVGEEGPAAAGSESALESAHYVVVREGQHSIYYLRVAVADSARGNFSLIVPVVAGASPRAATDVERALFMQLDDLAAPRLVEFWEQDPCEFHTGGPDDGVAERHVSADAKPPAPPKTVGTLEVAIHADAAAVKEALEANGHALGDAKLDAGASFLVARAPEGAKSITVRWEADSPKLDIPVRLLRHHGSAEVVIDVLGSGHRFEAGNRVNLAAPANTNVKFEVKGSTRAFHHAVLDKLFTASPDAVVTDYAWSATTCSPCPGPPLSAGRLSDVGVGTGAKNIAEVLIFTDGKIAKKPDGPPALRSALMACYGKALAEEPAQGEVTVAVTLDGGAVKTAKASTSDGASEVLQKCAEASVEATTFDGSGASGNVRVQFHPISRKYVADLVVTRLRTRVTDETKSDVELRPGAPIAGGGEVGPGGGSPKIGAYPAPQANHFQARYTVRHKWAGDKPTCMNPTPGKWGAPPPGVKPKPAIKGPADPKVDDLLDGKLPDAKALAMTFAGPKTQPPAPPPAKTPPPTAAPVASASPGMPPPSKPSGGPNPEKRWIGILALGVCAVALYLAQRAQA